MIELEVQVLAHSREGLLVEIGRVVAAHGFVLQRQRLMMDRHGALLTLVVAGAPRRQRALDGALGAHERVISHAIAAFEGGQMREHFAASRAVDTSGYVPSAPVAAAPAEPPAAAPAAAPPPGSTRPPAPVVPLPAFDPEEFLLPLEAVAAPPAAPPGRATDELPQRPAERLAPQSPPPPAPAPPPADPYVEIVPLPADEAAIERLLSDRAELSGELIAVLLQLDGAVAPGAREPTLQRAGQRLGAALARRDGSAAPMALTEAIERVGLPALRALAQADAQGSQLHIRHSPLCAQAGRSGCVFFTGLLEGALGPHVAAHEVSVFNVCCRAWGADECVLAISDEGHLE
ncbi:hypothetical protein ACO2Q2_14310 [Dyella sp. KRB-257]|uniref:hypothetical protein n=1 Tax=Dyella sp. KRB-257 TaxID=3400915 RepID=UPI003C03CB18